MTLNIPLLRAIQRRILERPEDLDMGSMQFCINGVAAKELGIPWEQFVTIRRHLGCTTDMADELLVLGGVGQDSTVYEENANKRRRWREVLHVGTIPYAVAVIQHIDAFIAKHNKVATEVRELEEVMVTPVGDVITQIAEEVMA